MPRRKHWRKSDSKRRERSRTDESETAVRSVGSPSNGDGLPATTLDGLPAVGSPFIMVEGSPSNVVAAGSPSNVVATGSPSNVVAPVSPSNVVAAGSPSKMVATGSPSNVVALSPYSVVAGSPSSVGASHTTNHSSNHSISQETQRNYQANISQFKQAIIDFKSIIASDSSNTQTDFDIVFLDTFPDVAANYQSKDNKELSERESISVCPVNTFQQNEEHDRNVTAQHHLSSDPLEICPDNDVACYQAIRSSERLWNASDLVFGSFQQNDGRFSEHSRGYQCTCNALCMLSYAHCGDVDNSTVLDKVLCEGDALYQTVIRKLKSDGKFIHHLLSLEEIPDDFELEIGKFSLEKFRIVSGPLIDSQDLGLPTLHEVLQSAFLYVSSGLLTIGAICSAVFKKKGSYAFFDSHCHGHNGLSATDGASSLIFFSSLDDLVTYMYAFYDSMRLDTNLQFDFLPINVKKSQNKQSNKDEMASHMEAYFNDQRLRQANKTQSESRRTSNDLSSISMENQEKLIGLKERNFKIAKSISKFTEVNVDKTQLSKQKKQCIRKNQSNLQGKTLSLKQRKENQSNLQEETLFLRPKKLCIRKNQSNLQGKTLSIKERKENQSNLQEESLFLRPKKLCIRKNQSNLQEETLFLRPKKLCIRKNQSNLQGKTLYLKQRKENQSNLQEETLFLRPKKLCIRKNQSNLQEVILFLRPKKLCTRKSQSNLPEETLFLRPKKLCIRKYQSNLQDKILFLRLKKLCIRRNQRREREKIRILRHGKKYARTHPKERQGQIRMFLNVRELRSNK